MMQVELIFSLFGDVLEWDTLCVQLRGQRGHGLMFFCRCIYLRTAESRSAATNLLSLSLFLAETKPRLIQDLAFP